MLLKDFRLMAVAPFVAALFLALAPPRITARFYSMFDPHDATRLDRVAMLHRVPGIVVHMRAPDADGNVPPRGRERLLLSPGTDERAKRFVQRAGLRDLPEGIEDEAPG